MIEAPLSDEQADAARVFLAIHLNAAKLLRSVLGSAAMLVALAELMLWLLPPDQFEPFRIAYRFLLPAVGVLLAETGLTLHARLRLAADELRAAKLLPRAQENTLALATHIRWVTYLGPVGNQVLSRLAK